MTDIQYVGAHDAARIIGISLDTLRRWDAAGKIVVKRDDANRRIVPLHEIRRLAALRAESTQPQPGSARNRIACVVTGVEADGFLARIEMETVEPTRLVAVITRESAEELDLQVGSSATAIVKATSMMINT